MMKITLKPVTNENWQEALQLEVHSEQQKFVADAIPPVAIALAKAYVRPGNKLVAPYAIYSLDRLVGFLSLHYTPDSFDDFWIFHFFIDKRYQGQGYGQATIDQLVELIKQNHPTCHRIRLTVHPENKAGQQFYTKVGFVSDNVLTFGEPTYSLSLEK